jgi:large subunit ribosomal protein L31
MKEGIHPEYHEITVIMTDGSEFTTRSTYGEAGAKLHLDVDKLTHPAWTGGTAKLSETDNQVAKFRQRFGAFDFGKTKN